MISFLIINGSCSSVFGNDINSKEILMSFEDNKISIEIPKNISIEFIDYNTVKLVDKLNNINEILPTQTVDMDGKILNLSYIKTKDGLDIYPSYNARWGWWDGVKCIAGVIGSVGTGALGGSAVGTITIPGVGTVSGTIIGSVSGGLVGIASFC